MSSPSPAETVASDAEAAPKCRDVPEEYQALWMHPKKARDRIRAEIRVRMWYEICEYGRRLLLHTV